MNQISVHFAGLVMNGKSAGYHKAAFSSVKRNPKPKGHQY